MFNNKEERNKIKKLILSQKTEDRYILDDENAIIVIHSDEPTGYIMIHERLVDNKLIEINRWPIRSYYFGSIHNAAIISDFNLFQVQNNDGHFNAIYDYKKDIFVVPQNTWRVVNSGHDNDILKKYGGFLASFYIHSDYEESDIVRYENLITGEKMIESFGETDVCYYAILELDGTIRGNKLFKGSSFSKITEIIDLNKYKSLEDFKQERRQLCNDTKKKKKQKYYQMLATRNDESISPYLDSEVAKVLSLKNNLKVD